MENRAQDEPSKLSYRLLKQITNDFHQEQIIGRGGFGTVYKGVHETHGEIAVKVLHSISGFDDKEFHKEFENLRRLKHPNIVKLVGFCNESEEELVVFEGNLVTAERLRLALCLEYVQNGSLKNHISDENTGLTWHIRYKIIKGICEGLKYLREGTEYSIMHFDLKPDNILLDKSMGPKIADFGLSKLFGEENTRKTLSTAGTIGYCPPEYITHQIISSQFDIFSLGVIMIRIMTGHDRYNSVVDMTTQEFVELVHGSWRKRLRRTLSHTPLEVYCNQVKICIEIALDCLNKEREKRPNIQDIVSRLNKTEIIIGDQGVHNEQPYQDDPGESIIPSRRSITSRPSSGYSEGSSSIHSNDYLSATEPMAITFLDLDHMTNGFSEDQLIGTGGFGKVYKGVLNGEVIAVKKLYTVPALNDHIFKNELLNLMRAKHQNIVRLVGYCSETRDRVVEHNGKVVVASVDERALCLEYMDGGSLDKYMSDESCGLDWEERYKIIKGICQGLYYLHTGSKYPIYHLDLKPGNILLDKDMTPKIGDFGLSRILGSSSARTFHTSTFIGTFGYLPPEYIEGGAISDKFDVFSLGIIVINLIAGQEGYYTFAEMSSQEFINLVTENWRKRVQPKEMSLSGLVEVQKCIKIGLRCVESNRENRPSITKIVEELNMLDFHLAAISC